MTSKALASVLVQIVLAGIGLLSFLWGWGILVEKYVLRPHVVRTILLFIVCSFALFEVWFCHNGLIHPWTDVAVTFCNMWGMVDAVLRYPTVYDIDTIFCTKQMILLVLKILSYVLGFGDIPRNFGWFMFAILVNVWTVPLLYITALPVCDDAPKPPSDLDQDVLVKIWRFIVRPAVQEESIEDKRQKDIDKHDNKKIIGQVGMDRVLPVGKSSSYVSCASTASTTDEWYEEDVLPRAPQRRSLRANPSGESCRVEVKIHHEVPYEFDEFFIGDDSDEITPVKGFEQPMSPSEGMRLRTVIAC
jgi:hypothetical protein